MRLILLRALFACSLLWPAIGRAQMPSDIMALVRADRWDEAQLAASTYLDPVVGKLVTYYRLLAPGAATSAEIEAFQAANPDWPGQGVLTRRLQEAEANTTDDSGVPQICTHQPPGLAVPLLLRCADLLAHANRTAEAQATAQTAWIAGDDTVVARMQQHWGPQITRDSQWRRFDRLAWTDTAAAARQLPRLDPADKPRAEARLALRRDAVNAEALLAALPEATRAEPGLVFELARYLRRANRDDQATALWIAQGADAERAAPAERRTLFWDERNILARRRLRADDAAGAYKVVAGNTLTGGEQLLDADFLAGFISLRRLGNPEQARTHFQHLAGLSRSVLTQSRAHYWLARAGGGAAEYTQAAAYPNTFYGQLAVLALHRTNNDTIRAAREKLVEPERGLALAGREVARAAAYLVGWGETRRAEAFLFRLDEISADAIDRMLVARLAAGFGMVETAVTLARRAGRDGLIQIDTGWPLAVTIPADSRLDPALALGIIRQESSFDGSTISPVGARGLMQLMPGTAAQVARQLGLQAPLPSLTTDNALNIRLGTTYLRSLLDLFGDVVPFAVGGYNAGPGRINEWLGTSGDPRTADVDMIDWIELIPFNETRNYVQRVIENQVVYTALVNASTPHPLARWLK